LKKLLVPYGWQLSGQWLELNRRVAETIRAL